MRIRQYHSKGLKFNKQLLARFASGQHDSEILGEHRVATEENIAPRKRDIVADGRAIYDFLTS